MGFTALDILVILLVGGGLVFGWLRGFVAEVLSLFAWFLAILALRVLYTPLVARAGAADRNRVGRGGARLPASSSGCVFVGGKLVSRRVGTTGAQLDRRAARPCARRAASARSRA